MRIGRFSGSNAMRPPLVVLVRLFVVVVLASEATGCASMLGDVNQVLAAVNKEDANKVRETAREGLSYEDGTPKIDGTNVCGERPLHLAIQKSNLEIVQILLQEGADPNLPSEVPREPSICRSFGLVTTPPGLPPLHYAITSAKPRLAEALLLGGADPMRTTPSNETALDLAQSKVGLEMLVAYMRSPLHLGARTGDIGKLRGALNGGAAVDGVLDVVGTTPIEEALLSRRWYVADFLLDHGAGTQSRLSSDRVGAAIAEYLAENPSSKHAERLRRLAAAPLN